MFEMMAVERLVSQPIEIKTAIVQVKIFFAIVTMQFMHLFYTLKTEVRT
tara:strand:+ start:400 stop:546 length:147 start_codon:yes stop_codon:yes gene_type:complete